MSFQMVPCEWRVSGMYQESNKQVNTSLLRPSEPRCCNVLVRLKTRDKTLLHIVTFRVTHPKFFFFFIICVQLICDICNYRQLSSDQVVFLLLGMPAERQEHVKSLYLQVSQSDPPTQCVIYETKVIICIIAFT